MATQFDPDLSRTAQDDALRELLGVLWRRGYRFVTPTPETHSRVLARSDRRAGAIEDVLGWSLPFADDSIDREVFGLLRKADAVVRDGRRWRSRLRVSTLHGQLFIHSAFPTNAKDAVFFGPDSYRFADFILSELRERPLPAEARVADIGTGAGVAALIVGAHAPDAQVIASDPNPQALRFARINLAAAAVTANLVEALGVRGIAPARDLITINPPYIMDDGGRTYRDGGGMHGGALSLSLATEAMAALAPGGRLLLYTGSAIVGGRDELGEALAAAAGAQGCTLAYREIDPDVFGEELDGPGYADVDRIAAVGAVFRREHR